MGLILVYKMHFLIGLTLFRIGLFGAAHRSGARKRAPPPPQKSFTHILQ